MRFVWLQMFELEHCPAVPDRSSQRGRPQPALTELACVAMVSLCRRWRDRCAGLSQTCRCFGVNAEGLEKVASIGRLGGPRPPTVKSWTPLLRIGDANSNAA
jgi:hypothetical protein